MQPVLSLESIVKRYANTQALGPVDIDVAEGEFLTLLGPSGCGKTTTLQIIAGLNQPTEGTLLLKGRDITSLAPPYRDIGLVFQNYALFPHRTIAENVAFGLRMRKVPKEDIARRVRQMLDVVGLPGVEDRYPHQLSGGQRQRVAVARAVVIEPSILLLDEPLSNLDALLRKHMRHELREIQQRLGITTVFVTHDQDEAFEMSDRVILMHAGTVQQVGAPEDIYDKPKTRFAAEFIGEASLNPATVASIDGDKVLLNFGQDSQVEAQAVAPVSQVGQSVLLMTRPERIELSAIDAPNALPMTIVSRVFQGERILVELSTSGGTSFRASLPSVAHNRALRPGQKVGAILHECRAILESPHAA
ncbi:ABC transporter ATP-binding protein [Devosia sp. 1566]|uniref:ABC transporter ATP-binding protein n=1 Tax=Devosia sp. 1566 TaxID=2499144 RepID=UPI000FDB8EB2|nr:ABC transporter ATP-binding protein [Devosia sp. 1566]